MTVHKQEYRFAVTLIYSRALPRYPAEIAANVFKIAVVGLPPIILRARLVEIRIVVLMKHILPLGS